MESSNAPYPVFRARSLQDMQRIVEEHSGKVSAGNRPEGGGSIRVGGTPDGGALFEVRLPIVPLTQQGRETVRMAMEAAQLPIP